MANPEWGAKRICHSCGTRYYDMQRNPVICPKCGTEFDPEAFLKSRRSRAPLPDEPTPSKARSKKAVEEEDLDETAPDAAEDDEGIVEDEEEEAEEIEEIDEVEEPIVESDEEDPTADQPDEKPFDEDEDLDEEEDEDVLIEDADDLDDDVEEVVDIEDEEDPDR